MSVTDISPQDWEEEGHGWEQTWTDENLLQITGYAGSVPSVAPDDSVSQVGDSTWAESPSSPSNRGDAITWASWDDPQWQSGDYQSRSWGSDSSSDLWWDSEHNAY